MIGNWTHATGSTVIDTQIASNQFFQDDLLLAPARVHARPIWGCPAYIDDFCTAQGECMLPQVNIDGYQGMSTGASRRATRRRTCRAR